jgi:hypothetical protein
MITLEPTGVVVGGRSSGDDEWGEVESIIRLDPDQFDRDAAFG